MSAWAGARSEFGVKNRKRPDIPNTNSNSKPKPFLINEEISRVQRLDQEILRTTGVE